jgi:hypothetical protein
VGEAKRKQYSRRQFLLQHPRCAYCGAPATTTDHCPPRCFFERRHWPETYEFPACEACNREARLDEQALAVIARVRPVDGPLNAHDEWRNLLRGVANNQPEFLLEWRNISATQLKKLFRNNFGDEGDKLRWSGWGLLNIGPLTRAAIDRFCVKLGKALYYRHIQELFDGDIYVTHIDPIMRHKDKKDYIDQVLALAPVFALPERNSEPLTNQFMYRYNHSVELGALYVVVRFGPQMVFPIMVLRYDLAVRLRSDTIAQGLTEPTRGLFHCPLAPTRAEDC